jgi:hypothetical protein
MNGVFLSLNNLNDSRVCGSRPCWEDDKNMDLCKELNRTMISTTKIAMLHKELPRLRRLVNDSCPGVSIINNPGILYSWELSWYRRSDKSSARVLVKRPTLFITAVFVLIASTGKYVAPICCVIPPASPSCTFV